MDHAAANGAGRINDIKRTLRLFGDPALKGVRIDHGGADIAIAHGADVTFGLQQAARKTDLK